MLSPGLPASAEGGTPIQPGNLPNPRVAAGLDAAAAARPAAPSRWVAARRSNGRLTNAQLGLVINQADAYSREVGAYYAQARRLDEAQILRLELPAKPTLLPDEFARLDARIRAHFGPHIQALALAWAAPYAVACNSITGALAFGYDVGICNHTCAATAPSPYFNAASARPFKDFRMRPSMLLAAHTVEQAKALIDRGVASDGSLGLRGAPAVQAHFIRTEDSARNVRAALYPPAGPLRRAGIDVQVHAARAPVELQRVLIYQTGASQVDERGRIGWVPGALADHLTSSGGRLADSGGQSTALDWIEWGATASYGTVSEPCNHLQKFPHPQLLLQHYAQGSTAIEAYWKSVAWPRQGVFVGEPLAAPFARR